jgi:hypothetical protein
VSIAGGDPLCHPEVVEIVRRVTKLGRKAILNTNGVGLSRDLLVELKKQGLVGLTFHVDSRQGRPGWRNKTEKQMCELRSQYAELVASVGGLACAFNSTVYEETLEQVPDVLDWAGDNIDIVHTVVFITYRAAVLDSYDYYAHGKKVDMSPIVYSLAGQRRTDISSREVVKVIQRRHPDFRPAAYLNGTERPDTLKWLMGVRLGQKGNRIHGYVGPKFVEMTQSLHHLFFGRYLAYSSPAVLSAGRSLMTSCAWDPGVRGALGNWAKSVVRNPLSLLKKEHVQAVLVIQPIDMMEDGRQNMCDGCPDMTLHEGKLAWSCRLEELKQFGCWVHTVPRKREREEAIAAQ